MVLLFSLRSEMTLNRSSDWYRLKLSYGFITKSTRNPKTSGVFWSCWADSNCAKQFSCMVFRSFWPLVSTVSWYCVAFSPRCLESLKGKNKGKLLPPIARIFRREFFHSSRLGGGVTPGRPGPPCGPGCLRFLSGGGFLVCAAVRHRACARLSALSWTHCDCGPAEILHFSEPWVRSPVGKIFRMNGRLRYSTVRPKLFYWGAGLKGILHTHPHADAHPKLPPVSCSAAVFFHAVLRRFLVSSGPACAGAVCVGASCGHAWARLPWACACCLPPSCFSAVGKGCPLRSCPD